METAVHHGGYVTRHRAALAAARPILRRLPHILRVVIAHGIANVVASRPRLRWLARWAPLARLTGPERFRRLFEDLGGSFVKFGQMLALQPDIVSLEYCDELFNLLDRMAPFPYEFVEQVFREELGQSPSDLFDHFDPVPLATASIGQVHAAVLHGRKVAVKVQRPGVEADFDGDLRLLVLAMRFIRRLQVRSLYWVLDPGGEFISWTREELDYRREARYAERLRRNAEFNPQERVPAIVWELTTRRTLVMEFMSGMTVLDYLRALTTGDEWTTYRLRADGFDPNLFARHIIDNFLGDAFQYGVFHADLHPANLLVLPQNVVGYVDFGITGVLSRYSRRHLVEMTLAYTRADVRGMADAYFKLVTYRSDADPDLFRRLLAETSQDWYEEGEAETVFRKNFTLVMLDFLTLSRKAGIGPERDVVKYIRSTIAADGLITRFAPGFSVGRHLEDVCQQWIAREARRVAFSYNTLTALVASGGRLIEDGPARAASVLRRVAEGEALGRVDITTIARRDERVRKRTIRLAGIAVAFTALLELTGAAPELGLNLFTVEAALVAGALLLLADSLRELAFAG
ncbi:MAG TPA: AarF/UbiB family protein [Vicinamibacterales bacterium]|nr:AarF/UbiB family protein [Vicinamibacterales bacterium]